MNRLGLKASIQSSGKAMHLMHRCRLTFLLATCSLYLSTAFAQENRISVLYANDIDSSVKDLPAAYAPLRIALKTRVDTFDAKSRFNVELFASMKDPVAYARFWQSVPIYNGDAEVPLFEWQSADCSISEFALTAEQKPIRLGVSRRLSKFPEPQNLPSRQLITVYELRSNHDHIPGKPDSYFINVSERTTEAEACTSEQVNELLRAALSTARP
jgi:hypothetical protein